MGDGTLCLYLRYAPADKTARGWNTDNKSPNRRAWPAAGTAELYQSAISHTRYDRQTPPVSRLRTRRSDGRRTASVLSRYQSVEQSIRALSIIPAVWSGIDFREPRSRPITTPAPASNAPPSSERCLHSPLQPRLVHPDYECIKCAVVLACCTADNPPSPGLAALQSLIRIQPRRLLHSLMTLTHTRLR